ncbi:MAG TPA: site-2 protease family protein [Candidatus Hydrogenedentes bacterium]|nr:site-2 protease family protein [Candidatus Hydrogenedentota bacterium]
MDVPIAEILAAYVCLLFCLTLHEAAHAWAAERAGDPTGRLLGRITLNPLAHIDPFGTVLFPLTMMMTGLPVFGWAKPVPFQPTNLKNRRWGPVVVALAGPFSHLFQLLVLVFGARVAFYLLDPDISTLADSPWVFLLILLVHINLVLMLFNLIPVPPLDGHHVLYAFLPPAGQRVMDRIGPWGILIALLIMRYGLGAPLAFLRDLVMFLLFGGLGVSTAG